MYQLTQTAGLMTKLNELYKLTFLLDENDIPFSKINKDWYDPKTHEYVKSFSINVFDEHDKTRIIDAICHPYSYGWDGGLLEVMGHSYCKDITNFDVKGCLTAEEALELIKTAWERACSGKRELAYKEA